MKKKLVILLILAGFILAACGGQAAATSAPADTGASASEGEVSTQTVSFANDVMPILETSCISCHGDQQQKGGLSLASYADLMAGKVVVSGNAQGSLLIQFVESGKMPARGDKLTSAQVQTLSDWVNQGTQDN